VCVDVSLGMGGRIEGVCICITYRFEVKFYMGLVFCLEVVVLELGISMGVVYLGA
jgi:hypothetical protein